MNDAIILRLLEEYKAGNINDDKILEYFHRETFEDMGYAKIDHQREAMRKGFPEVVFGSGKTVAQSASILEKLFQTAKGNLMATRVEEEVFLAVKEKIPQAEYHPLPKMITSQTQREQEHRFDLCAICRYFRSAGCGGSSHYR